LNKGIQILGKAWPVIQGEIPQCWWLLCGPVTDFIEKEDIARLRKEGVDENIYTIVGLEKVDVLEHLAAAAVNVNPTLGEGLNMVVVEAAAVGAASITSDNAGVAGWVKKFKAGTVVPKGDSGKLSKAVIDFFHFEGTGIYFQKNCYQLTNEFRLRKIAENLMRFFHNAERTI
jgi:glycosyltransferase involved in cell wall biosynthesis